MQLKSVEVKSSFCVRYVTPDQKANVVPIKSCVFSFDIKHKIGHRKIPLMSFSRSAFLVTKPWKRKKNGVGKVLPIVSFSASRWMRPVEKQFDNKQE